MGVGLGLGLALEAGLGLRSGRQAAQPGLGLGLGLGFEVGVGVRGWGKRLDLVIEGEQVRVHHGSESLLDLVGVTARVRVRVRCTYSYA